MLIISKFHDYYDAGAQYGIDKTVIYKRETEEIEKRWWSRHTEQNYKNFTFYHVVIGFCGEVHSMMKCHIQPSRYAYTIEPEVKNFYDISKFNEFLTENDIPIGTKKKTSWGVRRTGGIHFEGISKEDMVGYRNMFKKHNTPCFVIDSNVARIRINPKLKDYSFGKVKDAITAFNDIFAYITNYLTVIDNPEEIEDKHKATQHGFDNWSFKRHSHGRKSRRKQNK